MLNSQRKFKLKTNTHAHPPTQTRTAYMCIGTCVCSRKANCWAGNARTKMANRRALRPRKEKKLEKYHIQKKFAFYSRVPKWNSRLSVCVCVCNKYIHASQTHAQFTPIQTRQVYMQKINTIRTHPQTTAHQLHIHRTACRCECYTWRHRLIKSK